jgi:hypothetical protein
VCGAEPHFELAPRMVGRLLVEGFYLHWYHVGRIWSTVTRNQHCLRRIT